MAITIGSKPPRHINRQDFEPTGRVLAITAKACIQDGRIIGWAFLHPDTNKPLTHPSLKDLIQEEPKRDSEVRVKVKWVGELPIFSMLGR